MVATVLGRSLRQLFVVRAVYMQVRYDEIPDEMKNMLIKVGSKLDFIGKDIPVLSVPGWMGRSATTCPWWKGVFLETTKFHVETLYDVLDEVCKVLFVLLIEIPQLQISKSLRILKSSLSQGTHSSESFGAAPVRQVAPAEMLEVVELESPLPAESPVQVYVTAPVVVAPSCGDGVRPTCSRCRVRHSSTSCHPRGTCLRCRESHSGSDCGAHGTTDHDDSTCYSCFPAIGHGADRDMVCAAGDPE